MALHTSGRYTSSVCYHALADVRRKHALTGPLEDLYQHGQRGKLVKIPENILDVCVLLTVRSQPPSLPYSILIFNRQRTQYLACSISGST